MEEKNKKIIKIDISGATYTLKTDSDEEYIKKISDIINERIKSISEKNPGFPFHKITGLCLIETMDEMLKIKDKLNKIETDLSDKASHLIKRIEETLTSDYTIV